MFFNFAQFYFKLIEMETLSLLPNSDEDQHGNDYTNRTRDNFRLHLSSPQSLMSHSGSELDNTKIVGLRGSFAPVSQFDLDDTAATRISTGSSAVPIHNGALLDDDDLGLSELPAELDFVQMTARFEREDLEAEAAVDAKIAYVREKNRVQQQHIPLQHFSIQDDD